MNKKILVLGAGGFIGSHVVKRLKEEGHWVRGVDLKHPEFSRTAADHFILGDLRREDFVEQIFKFAGYNRNPHESCASQFDLPFDEVYQFAADMGGAGYIFTGEHDADIMHNSAIINLHIIEQCIKTKVKKVFYSSSACMYPAYNQEDPDNPMCAEESAYPAAPDSEYGWEKLFSERLYLAAMRNYGLEARICRYHNIFGPEGTWAGGREKSPAAMCRKVAEAQDGGEIEVWGDGKQTRSFMYIDECVEATRRLMDSDFIGPVNIGSEEMIAINDLAKMAIKISGKSITIKNVPGPVGVRGRNSDNKLYKEKIGWETQKKLVDGMTQTYKWIEQQVKENRYKDNDLDIVLKLGV
jgi:nucleoside-diphosphate-sugar epimerase